MRYPAFRGLIPALSYLLLTVFASTANAKMELNAMCIIDPKDQEKVMPYNPSKDDKKNLKIPKISSVSDDSITAKYPIASVSKVVTTGWALAKLGPEYRFKTEFSLFANKEKKCGIHIAGDMDPFFGKDYLEFVVKDLQKVITDKKLCSEVSQVTFDDNFRYSYSVLDHQDSHKLSWRNPVIFKSSTSIGLKDAFKKFKGMEKAEIRSVSVTEANDFLAKTPHKTYATLSAPLYLYLKEMNKYSHNYSANILFERLGGAEEFEKFAKETFDFTKEDLLMMNGSGYPVNGKYNQATCASIVTIISSMSERLSAYVGSKPFTLSDVLAVAGAETYATFDYSEYKNEMVAKTGTANPVISFAGMLQTESGPLYFAVLTKTQNKEDQTAARSLIRKLMKSVKASYELETFKYATVPDLTPYQRDSHLYEIKGAKLN